ncbi:DUF2637 domain-containing protein [Streptomyces sp. NPDC002225]|uniref:DUF2637 domain-containing protein n=1 Tax=Streptomyces sp. NPDC002225 TaxID=3154413 RepID=UPI00331BC76A
MHDVLTDDQTPATQEATAPARSTDHEAIPAAKAPLPLSRESVPLFPDSVPEPQEGAPGIARAHGHQVAGMAAGEVRTAPADRPLAGAEVASRPGPKAWSPKAMRWLILASVMCAGIVGSIGFAGSYDALRSLAEERGFGRYSYVFPIGIDAGIIAMYGLDLVLVWQRMPKPLLRLTAHLLTIATIVFNVNAGEKNPAEDPLGAAMHGALPILFVAVIEAARHLIIHTNRLSLAVESDRVPLHRWLLAPWSAWSLYRRMRLYEVPSYARMIAMEKDRTVYRAWLQHQHGRRWKKRARAEELLPFTMAPFGLSVDEALALPRLQKEAADARAAAEQDRIEQAAVREEQRLLDAEARAAKAKVRRMQITAGLATAESRITAETLTAEAQTRVAEATSEAEADAAAHQARLAAEAARKTAERELQAAERRAQAAERAAEREETAEKSAAQAEAEARVEAAHRQAEEDRLAAAAAQAEAAHRSAEAERAKAEEARNLAEQHEAAARTAQAERETAEAAAATAAAREATARAELAAQEAEDEARLTARERGERRVARMILNAHATLPTDQRPAHPDMYAVSIEEISALLNVSKTAAGDRRQAADELIRSGYRG